MRQQARTSLLCNHLSSSERKRRILVLANACLRQLRANLQKKQMNVCFPATSINVSFWGGRVGSLGLTK